jgi:hypothetical protein
MYCQHCGKLGDGISRYCTGCGNSSPSYAPGREIKSAKQKLEGHIKVMGVLWLAYSALRVLAGMMVLAFSHFIVPIIANAMPPDASPFPVANFLQAIYGFVFVYCVITGILGAIAGYGLLQRQSWGRTMALVMAFISLFSLPFGTAMGVYTLIVLLPADASENYDRLTVVPA